MKLEFEEIFISVLRGKLSIQSFETWLYDNYEILEKLIGIDKCLELLNLNYKSKYVVDKLEAQLVEILGYDAIEDFNIRDLLSQLISIIDDDEFINICRRIYNEY